MPAHDLESDLIQLAARRCAARGDWQATFSRIRKMRRFERRLLVTLSAVAIGGMIPLGGIPLAALFGAPLPHSLQMQMAPFQARHSHLLLANLSAVLFGMSLMFSCTLRMSIGGDSWRAALPIDDDHERMSALARNLRFAAGLLGIIGCVAYCLIVRANNGSALDWVCGFAATLFVVTACWSSMWLTSVGLARWLPSAWLMLVGSAVMFISLIGIGHWDRPFSADFAKWSRHALVWAPTSWASLGFESVVLNRQPLGFFWLAPIAIITAITKRFLHRPLKIVEYRSLREGSERPVFSPDSPVATVALHRDEFFSRERQPAEPQTNEPIIPDSNVAAEIIERELRFRGEVAKANWPIPLLAGMLTKREQLLAELVNPWLARWRIPWLFVMIAEGIALTSLWFVPYDPKQRETVFLVLQMSLFMAFAVLLGHWRRTGYGGLTMLGSTAPLNLPITLGEWFKCRCVIAAGIVLGTVLPLSGLLAFVYHFRQNAPIDSMIAEAALATLICLATVPIAAASEFLIKTNLAEAHPFWLISIFLLGAVLICIPMSVIHLPQLSSVAVAGAISLALIGCLILACRFVYLRGHCDIRS
jgi:hypothetical protein